MAREKKPVHRVQMTEGKRSIIHQRLEEYDIQTAEDIQDALKPLFGGTITVSSPFLRDIHHCQIQHFQKAVIRRKDRLGFCHFPKLPVEAFNGIGCYISRLTASGYLK